MIGVVGDSGAGKSTFAAGLAQYLGSERTLVICIDDYHRYSRQDRTINGLTPHDPACNYVDILEQHVDLLRDRQPILKPVYNHNGGILEPPEYVVPRDFIILEGLLGFTTERLRDAFDVKFYLDPSEQIRLRWKFQRDTGPGGFGYTIEQVMASLPKLKRDSALYVAPQRGYADMVVSFYAPDERPEEIGALLNARHILRPTLPPVDLSVLLETSVPSAPVLELARDIDGRPADALHVFGEMNETGLEELSKRLREHAGGEFVPSCGPGGRFRDAQDVEHVSRSLALSQLLVACYVLNAAPAPYVS